MALPRVLIEMLEAADTEDRVMPASELYSERWMLRLVLAAAKRGIDCLPFTFEPGARWFSEPQLYSAFCRRTMRDALAERTTSADGVVGHFRFAPSSKTGLALNEDATQFIVLEAKMAATLSKGTKNAPGFDQAARTVACMAETLRLRGRPVDTIRSLGFYVVAPRRQLERLASHLEAASIKQKVLARIEKYDGAWRTQLDKLVAGFFEPLMQVIRLERVAWEDILDRIAVVERDLHEELEAFYERALYHNFRGRP